MFDNEIDDTSTVFRDMTTLALLVFLMIFVILLVFINDNKTKKSEGDVVAPGNLIYELSWPNTLNADIDTWILTPDETIPVGYSSRNGINANLLRDDLGTTGDLTNTNIEQVFVRNLKPGRYIINAHYYNFYQANNKDPIPLHLIVKLIKDNNVQVLFEVKKEVARIKDEVTMAIFNLDDELNYMQSSLNTDIGITLRGSLYKMNRNPGHEFDAP